MAKKNNVKKLTPTELKKQVKKLDEQREVLIPLGDTEYSVTYDLHFKKSKQHALMDDLVKFFDAGSTKVEILDMASPYTVMLIIKHFTSVDVPDDIEEALMLLEILIDLELLDKIVNELPEDELNKVFELIALTTTKFKETIDEMQKEAVNLVKEVENDEVKKKLQELIDNGEESTESVTE